VDHAKVPHRRSPSFRKYNLRLYRIIDARPRE
jgi:hypothetical protein